MTVIPPPTLFVYPGALRLFSLSLRFETIEVIEVRSQVVLNTLTEYDFQDAYKKWQKHWERCIHAEGEGDGGQ
jgi:hypothetical protein